MHEMTSDPYRYFRTEARDLIDGLTHGVLEIEKGRADSALLSHLLRAAHTLKGAARVVRQARMAECSHEIEEVLGEVRERGGSASVDQIKILLEHVDSLSADLAALTQQVTSQPAGARDAPTEPADATEDRLETIRVDTAEIDHLLRNVSDLGFSLARLSRQVREVRQMAQRVSRLRHERKTIRAAPAGTDADRTGVLLESIGTASRVLSEIVDRADGQMQRLSEQAAAMRLVPAASLFPLLERTTRDSAEAGGRLAEFGGSGGDVRLDAHTLRVLGHAFVQMVRNAAVHGIEPPAERAASGKPDAGRVQFRVQRRGDQAIFACGDDGRGIEVASVRQVVVSRGLVTEDQAAELTPATAATLLMRGGITTAPGVSQLAGRGIGLDVVRAAVASLNGTIAVWTEPGQGTRIEISVPVQVESQQVVRVRVGTSDFAIPLQGIRRTARLRPTDLAISPDGQSILSDGRSVRFVPLGQLLGADAGPRAHAVSALVLESGASAAAIGVDRVLGTSRVVIRSMPPILGPTPLLAGTFFDSEGLLRVVLSVDGVIRAAIENRSASGAPGAAARAFPPVLVIDDSLTTRMLQQGILEAAGYQVDTASSGEEALEKARRRRYGVFIVDVEMPGMDGFTFIRKAAADHDLRDVPSIVLTSRDSAEDRARGKQAGARAYIVKSAFDERVLLQTIQQIIG